MSNQSHFQTQCRFCLLCGSSDTLWDLAAAEVNSRESEDDYGERNVAVERTVFLMGSKAGVSSQNITHFSVFECQRSFCHVRSLVSQ